MAGAVEVMEGGRVTLQKPNLLRSAQEQNGALPNLVEPWELHGAISQLTSDPKRESITHKLTQKQ